MAASDCHRQVSQVKICGNYIDRGIVDQGMDSIKNAIVAGNFTRYGTAQHGPYVDRQSWILGVAGDILSALH